VRVIGKPVDFFAHIPANSGLHLVPIPFSNAFADHYALGEFTSEEYPTLVPEGQKIDTIAVPAVLAVFNWPKDSDRYRRVRRFTEALFTKWDKFQEPHRHPKWRDVNLAATVPGWTRWGAAEDMLRRMEQKDQNPAVSSLTEEPQQRSGVPQQRSSVPQQRSGVSQQRSSVSQQRSSVPQQRSSVPQQRSSVPQQRSGVPQQRSSVPQDVQGSGPRGPNAQSQQNSGAQMCMTQAGTCGLTLPTLPGSQCGCQSAHGVTWGVAR
jgi:hypothetical protein